MKTTQLEIVRKLIHENGQISRNQCLAQYITRLSARINDLEAEGYEFKTERNHGDYVYKLVAAPAAQTLSVGL